MSASPVTSCRRGTSCTTMILRSRAAVVAGLLSASLWAMPQSDTGKPTVPPPAPPQNPYGFEPFHADFPVDLSWPNVQGVTYDRTRRQILERLAANLQGNVRHEAWQMATEFYWRAPEDAVEPLIGAMDRAFGNAALGDVVKNVVEAMGKTGDARCESALIRALEHGRAVVRQAAYQSLAAVGTPETLRQMTASFPRFDGRARMAWLGAVRKRLGEEGVKLLAEVMRANYPAQVRDEVVKEALQLPPAQAVKVLAVGWETAHGEFQAIVAGVMHAAGDPRGTVWLQEALQGEDGLRMGLAVRYATIGDPGILRPLLLRASTHLRPEIRLEVAKALRPVSGDDVGDVYEVLAIPDEVWEVRAIALRELTRRGRGKMVGALLEDVRTATGTRLQLLLKQLAESGDPRAAAELMARYAKAPLSERRPYVQALAENRSDAAVRALLDLFAGEEQAIAQGTSGKYTTISYVPTLLYNAADHADLVLGRFLALDRGDWRRRAALLPTLAGLAADHPDTAVKDRLIAPLRTILFDREELPQLRVASLNLLTTRWLGVEDALKLKNAADREKAPMRNFFHDFLNDYF